MSGVTVTMRRIIVLTTSKVLCSLLAALGIITNIINILVFYKQGFRDSITISFFVVSVLDLARSVLALILEVDWLLAMILTQTPAFLKMWGDVVVIVSSLAPFAISSLSAVITAYITLERCLCVCMPLKVKDFITTKVTKVVVTSASIVVGGSYLWDLCIYATISWKFTPQLNTSVITVDSTFCNQDVFAVYKQIVNILWSAVTTVVIAVCTILIVIRLRSSSKFRSQSRAGNPRDAGKQAQTLSVREQQLIKVLLIINLIHLCSTFPSLVGVALFRFLFVDKLDVTKATHSRLMVLEIRDVFYLVNASVNFFVYLKMSSNFKTTLKALLN